MKNYSILIYLAVLKKLKNKLADKWLKQIKTQFKLAYKELKVVQASRDKNVNFFEIWFFVSLEVSVLVRGKTDVTTLLNIKRYQT